MRLAMLLFNNALDKSFQRIENGIILALAVLMA
jgi:hypothetical protein